MRGAWSLPWRFLSFAYICDSRASQGPKTLLTGLWGSSNIPGAQMGSPVPDSHAGTQSHPQPARAVFFREEACLR